MMKPLQRYANDVTAQLVIPDDEQRRIVASFEELHAQLTRQPAQAGMLSSIFYKFSGMGVGEGVPERPQGIYLWGAVGRGKTYLMDLFYDCLPAQKKIRTHFHRFMQRVHTDLSRLQGTRNPLEKVADAISEESQVLCFDEFFVLDIADAMILAGLLNALFERGVVLVTTSNIHPDGLYENGLQRDRFLPAIELLKKHTDVLQLETGIDYRLRSLSHATLFHTPIDAQTNEQLLKSFFELVPDQLEIEEWGMITILDRKLSARYCADDIAWFEYSELCDGPRSAFDYVEIARLYHALIISDVPMMDDNSNDRARRFVNLIDELYDRRVKLIISAAVPIWQLYQGQQLSFEFERTQSRLLEMQSFEYLGDEHRA